jgi:hypothetical protein
MSRPATTHRLDTVSTSRSLHLNQFLLRGLRIPMNSKSNGILQQFLIGLGTIITLVVGKAWPDYSVVVWGVFLSVVGSLLFSELRKPVNYDALILSDAEIEYAAFGRRILIRFDEISKLNFVREEALFPDLSGPYIESKWLIQTVDDEFIEIMDEWPHRRQLLRWFRKNLTGFSVRAAREGFRASKEGSWHCFPSIPDDNG